MWIPPLQISRVEPPPRVPLPLQRGGDRCLAGVRPLRQQQQQLCPRRTCISPLVPLHWCQPGAAKTQGLGLHQTTSWWPFKLTCQAREALKWLPTSSWKKKCSKKQKPGSEETFRNVIQFVYIGGIMTKSKQNPLVLLPQGTPKASASGQRKELAAGKLYWRNSTRFWKLKGMGLPSFSCRCLAWQMISESELPFYL